VFYTHFRCGILHQAQTKKGSLIRYRNLVGSRAGAVAREVVTLSVSGVSPFVPV